MKINEAEIRELINEIGFVQHKTNDKKFVKIYKTHNDFEIQIDFETRKINYGKSIKLGDKTTSHFESSENFVVLECVNRLLEKGYKPENIELEKKWNLGHRNKGKADVFVKYPKSEDDTSEKAFLLIECKTWGYEFNHEFEKMLSNGGQLLSYYQQEQTTEFLCLYSSKFEHDELVFTNRIIQIKDEYKAKNKAEVYKIWNEQYSKEFKFNGIFDNDEDIKPYNKNLKNLKCKDLSELQEGDSGYIFNQFAEILRHNVVSDKPNAFNKMFNLILAKIVDEDSKPNDILKFQWYGELDTDIELQKRLNDLYKNGMLEYLRKNVTDFSDDEVSLFLDNPSISDEQKEQLKNKITELRLYKNNEFAFKEVFNEQSFKENAIVVREAVKLLQPYKIRYSHKQQFLSNFFELLLSNTLKQEAGQFFTPVPVAKFIVSCFPIKELIKNKIDEGISDFLPFVIDYAAGSGHFLTEVMDEVQQIVDDIDYSNCKPSLKQRIKTWQSKSEPYAWAGTFVYGIEKDYRLSKIAKVSCFLNGDGLANIIHADGLESFQSEAYKDAPLLRTEKEDVFDNQQFDILVANPPYSVSAFIKTLPNSTDYFETAYKFTEQSKEIECLFIERTKQLLKENGWAGIVLPSSILSNTGLYTTTREIILKYFKVIAIVEFGSATFMATGTNTISIFLERRSNFEWSRIKKAVERFFEEKHDFECNSIDKPFEKYVNQVFEIQLSDYITLIDREPNTKVQQTELYKDYESWYYNLTETINLKARIKKQQLELTKINSKIKTTTAEKETEKLNKRKVKSQKLIEKLESDIIRLFYERIFEKEQEKIMYFILTYPQKTILVKSNPKNNNKAEKAFLGYEFSSRRGHEGLRMFIDEYGNLSTKLYHETDREDPNKVNSYIYKHFKNEDFTEIASDLKNNVSIVNLHNLMNYKKLHFDKQISLYTQKETEVKLETKWKTVRLGDCCNIKIGGTPDRYNQQLWHNGKYLWVAISDMNVKIITDTKEKISDLGVEKSNVKLIKKGTTLLSFKLSVGKTSIAGEDLYTNEAIAGLEVKPEYENELENNFLYEYFSCFNLGKVNTVNKKLGKVLNSKDLQKVLVPIPDMKIQQKIINEIENITIPEEMYSDIKLYNEYQVKHREKIFEKYL